HRVRRRVGRLRLGAQIERGSDDHVTVVGPDSLGDLDDGGRGRRTEAAQAGAGNGVAAGVAHTGLPQHCADHRDGLLGGQVDRGLSTVHDLRVDGATGGPGTSGGELHRYLAGLIGAGYHAAVTLHVVARGPDAP